MLGTAIYFTIGIASLVREMSGDDALKITGDDYFVNLVCAMAIVVGWPILLTLEIYFALALFVAEKWRAR